MHSIKTPSYATIACVLSLLVACQVEPNEESGLAVIDGEIVTSPDQAPGTYGVTTYSGNNILGNASAVAVSNNTFITNGHVVQSGQQATRVDIRDYRGNVVTSFDPRNTSGGVRQVINPGFTSQTGHQSAQADIGAYVFNNPIPQNRLTHGTVAVGSSTAAVNQNIYMVGNGIQDYRALDPNKQGRTPINDSSGVLRRGTNTVAQTDEAGFFVNGAAFDSPKKTGVAVSGPGDSGGGVFRASTVGKPGEFVGLMQGGGMYNPNATDPKNKYFNTSRNPAAIKNQPNSAYSYVVDVTLRSIFAPPRYLGRSF